jgi:hypothetical protein
MYIQVDVPVLKIKNKSYIKILESIKEHLFIPIMQWGRFCLKSFHVTNLSIIIVFGLFFININYYIEFFQILCHNIKRPLENYNRIESVKLFFLPLTTSIKSFLLVIDKINTF